MIIMDLQEEKAKSEELRKEMFQQIADLNAKEVDTTSLRSQEKELEESKTFRELCFITSQLKC